MRHISRTTVLNSACNHAIELKMYGIAFFCKNKHFGMVYSLLGQQMGHLVGNSHNKHAFQVYSTSTTFVMQNIYFGTKRPVTCEKHVSDTYHAPQCLTRLATMQLS